MKRVKAGFYKMRSNEAVAVFAITFAVVIAYSAWGAYLLHKDTPSSPQVVSIGK